MRGYYEQHYEMYLSICRSKEGLGTPEQLKERIKLTERLHIQLIGMLNLLHACGELSGEERTEQFDRLVRDFSPIELFGAFIGEDGQVWSFREVKG